MRRFIMTLAAVFGFSMLHSANAQSQSLTMGTCGTGGGWYQAGTLMSNVISKNVEGLDINAVPTECAAFNLVALSQGRLDFAFTTSNLSRSALMGEGNFSAAGTKDKVRALFSYSVSYLHIFTLDPDIKSIKDLKGKRIAVGSPASSSYQQAVAILKAAGIDPETDVELVQVNLATGTEQLRGGQVDAEFWSMALDVPGMLELVNSRDTYFIPVPNDLYDKIPSELGLTQVEMPANAYPTVEDAFPTLGIYSIIVTTTDLDDEAAEKIVGGYFENLEEFKSGMPASAVVATKETALDGLPVPLHDGARAYYTEKDFPGLSDFDARLKASGVAD
ncbi:TAXI family TRAP transporter solute-binding subunit [Hoeflea sp. CAU 1731]